VLSERQNRYLACQLRWVEGIRPTPTAMDVDVVIGRLGPIAPPEICNGLIVPSWFLIKFTPSTAIRSLKAIPKSELSAEAFASASEELFDKITQMADKAGSTGEHRALNYLAVRYPPSVRNTIRFGKHC
jgi:hypothetical protein